MKKIVLAVAVVVFIVLCIVFNSYDLNISIELTKHYNPLIKIAKDCGSGATFSIFTVAVILNLIIFIPKIIIFFK